MTLGIAAAVLLALVLTGIVLVVRCRRAWLRALGAALVLAPLLVAWTAYREIRTADRFIALCLDRDGDYYRAHDDFHPDCGDPDAFR